MQTVYVKFLTEAARAKGFFELAKHSGIGSLPGQVYQVPLAALPILDEIHIDYRRATDAEVKTAYRRLMKENHPDKLVARGLPEAMIKLAQEKVQQINVAYDAIKQARGMK